LKKKEPVQYTVEREFLSKFSAEELLVRIIKSHINISMQEGNLIYEND